MLQGCAQQQAAAAGSSSGAPAVPAGAAALSRADLDAAGLPELARLLKAYNRSPLPAAALPTPEPAASADELALRRAHAFALRSCANPRCANLAGESEAALRGRRCTGCRVLHYCSEACSRLDWPAHKRACRLLRQ